MTYIREILNIKGRVIGFITKSKRCILYQYWNKEKYKYPDLLHTVICNNETELHKMRHLYNVIKAKRTITSS